MNLYTHIPYCAGKCAYCAFYSSPRPPGRDEVRDFVRALAAEFARQPSRKVRTWYVGGGTPSLLGPDGFRFFAGEFLPLADTSALEEWTVEANPASTTPELLETLRRIGVTRLSFGVQSFDDGVLRRAGRAHGSARVREVLRAAKAAGFDDIGIDLIAGLPGDTASSWRATLEETLCCGLRHVSVYALSIEPSTPFALQERRAWALDDDAMLERISVAEEALAKGGFARYEISNYAQAGFECRHNLAVWRGEDYLGVGPAASSRMGFRRWTRLADTAAYVAALRNGNTAPNSEEETLDERADAVERSIFRLRLAEGVNPAALAARFPRQKELFAAWNATLADMSRLGLVENCGPDGPAADGQAWRLTARGREVCDAVLAELPI